MFISVFKLTFLFKKIHQIFVQIDQFLVHKGLLKAMFIFNVYISIRTNCWCLFKLIVDIFVQNRVLISVQLDYFNLLAFLLKFQNDCWFFCSKWLFLFVHFFNQIVFKLIVHFLFKSGCWFFCSNWLLVCLFNVNVYIFIQNNCWYVCLKLIVVVSVQIVCWCFCSNLVLSKLIVGRFVHIKNSLII